MASYQPLQGGSIQSSTPTLYPPSNEDVPINSRTSIEPKVGRLSPNRTPSPTPSEARELETGAVNWKRLATGKFWFRKEWIGTLSLSSSFKPYLGLLDGFSVLCDTNCSPGDLNPYDRFSHSNCAMVDSRNNVAARVCILYRLVDNVSNVNNFQAHGWLAGSNCNIVRYFVSSGKQPSCNQFCVLVTLIYL